MVDLQGTPPVYLLAPAKRTQPADVGGLLRAAIAAEHGARAAAPAPVGAACAALSRLRRAAHQDGPAAAPHHLPSRVEYLKAAAFVAAAPSLPPLSRGGAREALVWRDAFDDAAAPAERCGLELDVYAMRWNVAAGCVDMALLAFRDAIGPAGEGEALRGAAKAFQRAAGLYSLLASLPPMLAEGAAGPDGLQALTPDLSHPALVAMKWAMLGNAQAASYDFSATTGHAKDAILSRLAAAARDFYLLAARHAGDPALARTAFAARIGRPAAVMADMYGAEAELRAELAAPEMQMSLRLARAREATAAIARAEATAARLDSADPITAPLKLELARRGEAVAMRSKECKRLNMAVYHEFEDATVPDIQGHPLVKEWLWDDEAAHADPEVQALTSVQPVQVPPGLEEYVALLRATVETQKDQVHVAAVALRDELADADGTLDAEERAADALAATAQQASRPSASATAAGAVSEKDALEAVRAAVREGGLPRLRDLRQQVRGLSDSATKTLDGIEASLAAEAADSVDVHRTALALGEKHSDSHEVTGPYYAKLGHVRSTLNRAQAVDKYVDEQLAQHGSALDALAHADFSRAEPGGSRRGATLRADLMNTSSSAKRGQLGDLRTQLGMTRQLLRQETSIVDALSAAAVEDDAETVTAGVVAGDDESRQVRQLVNRKLDKHLSRVAEFERQAAFLREALRKACDKAKAPPPAPPAAVKEEDSMAVVWQHHPEATKFKELLEYLSAGTEFYVKEADSIESLKTQTDDYVMSRKIVAQDINNAMAEKRRREAQPPPPPPIAQPQAYQAPPIHSDYHLHNLKHHRYQPQPSQQWQPPPPPLASSAPQPSQFSEFYAGGSATHGSHHNQPFALTLDVSPPPPPTSQPPPPPTTTPSQRFPGRFESNQYQHNFNAPPPPPPGPASSYHSYSQGQQPARAQEQSYYAAGHGYMPPSTGSRPGSLAPGAPSTSPPPPPPGPPRKTGGRSHWGYR